MASSSSPSASDDVLIKHLIERLSQELANAQDSGSPSTFSRENQSILKKVHDSLIELSTEKVNVIAAGLASALDQLASDTTRDGKKFATTVLYLLRLLQQCLQFQWDHIKAQLSTAQTTELSQDELIRIKEKEETILPPPLDETLARDIIRLIKGFLVRILNEPIEFRAELLEAAGQNLFQLSATNYDAVASVIHLNTSQIDDTEVQVHFFFLEWLNLNGKRLTDLLGRFCTVIPNMKKEAHRFGVAKSLRKAIWNWIDHYPVEFVKLCQSGGRMGQPPEQLFDVFDSWCASSSRKQHFWPIQTMLLILFPDSMMQASSDRAKVSPSESIKNKTKFLENIKKALKSQKLAEAAVVCYVDICKASIYVSNSAQSALRWIVPEVEVELKDRLFNPQQLFKGTEKDTEADRALMVDLLVALYRLSHRKVMNSLFQDCLSASSPPLFRTVLVECVLTLATEKSHLPWNPTISDVYGPHSGNFRQLFSELELKIRSVVDPAIAAASTKAAKALDTSRQLIDISTKLTRLFRVDPNLPLFSLRNIPPQKNMEEVRTILKGLCAFSCHFSHPDLADEATQALLVLHQPENIARWCPESPSLGFWAIGSAVLVSLGRVLIDRPQLTLEQVRKIVFLIEEVLVQRNKFLSEYKDWAPDRQTLPDRSQCSATLETALLIHLCSSQPLVCSRIASCFGLLCEEVELLGLADEASNTIAANLSIYRQLGDSCVTITGPKAQQKNIRSLLRRMERSTTGNCGAWEEVNKRWTEYTTALLSQAQTAEGDPAPAESSDIRQSRFRRGHSTVLTQREDFFEEWTNYTGFLTALSGAAIKKEAAPGRAYKAVVENFLTQLLVYVISPNINVRETVKMALGTALAPAAYSSLFRLLHEKIATLFGAAGQVHFSDDSTMFVDQTISIVKLIVELEGSTPADYAMLTDFEDLLLDLLKYVRQLVLSLKTIASKVRLCVLIDSMMARRQFINMRSEFPFRNTLIEILVEWTSEYSSGAHSSDSETKSADLLRKIMELDLQCMKAILALFQGLPLPGNDDEAKAVLFSNYFNFLSRCLQRVKKQPHTALPEMPDITIQSLSALVSANIDHGVEYFVRMGYHDDHATRASFLKVLANILNQGAEFGVERGDRYDKLVQLLLDHEMQVLLAWGEATPITEADEVCQLMIHLGEMTETTTQLVCRAIDAEVQRTESENTLFRRNSIATKLLTAYAKLLGVQYLKDVIAPIIKRMMQDHQDMELDPVKFDPPESYTPEIAAKNLQNLQLACQGVLDVISDSVDKCPRQMREICGYLRSAVAERFPDAQHTAVAGFFFLRFVCPSLVSPEGFGLVTGTLDRQTRRNLIVMTKSLQNLANRCHFTKELYMLPMNDFIDGNLPMIVDLFSRYSLVPDTATVLPPLEISDEEREHDLHRIHYHIHRSVDKIFKLLGSQPERQRAASSSSTTQNSSKLLADRLQLLMGQLGAPPESSKRITPRTTVWLSRNAGGSGNNVLFEQFMQKMTHRTDGVTKNVEDKNIFFQQGFTATQEPVFYYIARNYTGPDSADHIDYELLTYHCLKTVQPYFDKPWVLVVDLTLSSSINQLPPQTCNALAKMCPEAATSNLQKIFLLGVNPEFKQYARKVLSKPITAFVAKKIHFVTIKDLSEHIPAKQLKLPDLTVSVERDVKATFAPVFKISSQYGKKEVCLRISNDLLQIHSTKTYQVLGRSTTVCQLVPVSAIEEVSQSSEEEIFVKCVLNGSTQTLSFRSPSAKQIIQLLKASKDRFALAHQARSGGRTFRPSDIRGVLLNMSLLNLSSSNQFLREAAYNLLVTLSRTFNFSVREELLRSSGMFVPRNASHFVSRISSQLAQTETSMTLEFLLESLRAFENADATGKHLCLDYIRPWFPNLGFFATPTGNPDSKDKIEKASEVVRALIRITLTESGSLLPAILSKAWAVLGRSPEALLDVILGSILEATWSSTQAGGVGYFSSIQDIIITIAAENPQSLSGKLVFRLLRLLDESCVGAVPQLSDHPVWPKISVILNLLLVLSFENLVVVQEYLPELFHMITMLFSVGSESIRAVLHGLLINTVHSQYTYLASTMENSSGIERLQPLARALREEYDEPKFRLLFGLGNTSNRPRKLRETAASSSQTSDDFSKQSTGIGTSQIEIVATSLLSVLNFVSPNGSAHGTAHHSRWLSLVTSQAFKANLALQPRALVVLGVLCQSPQLVSDELFSKVLINARGALLSQVNEDTDQFLSLGVLSCLQKIFPYISPSSPFYRPVFWLAITLAQVNDTQMFASSLSLLEAILQTLDNNGAFDSLSPGDYMLAVRTGAMDAHLAQLDQVTGISFTTSFSFAVSAHLLKGLKHAQTKTQTMSVLKYLIDISTKQSGVGPNALGYLAALLPVGGSEAYRAPLLPTAETVAGDVQYHLLFLKEMLPDTLHGVLLFSTLVTILRSSEIEHEKLFIYEALKEGVQVMPEAFPTVYDILLHKMLSVISSSQNTDIVSAVLAIMKIWSATAHPAHGRLDRTYLAKIGFPSLSSDSDSIFAMDSSSMDRAKSIQRRKNILKIASSIIESILSLAE